MENEALLMNDVMVSVKMPRSLILELKSLEKKGHFIDLSEEVRSIVRNKWIESNSPELLQLNKLREEISDEIKKKSIARVREEVNKELQKIRDQLKEGDMIK